MNALPFLIECKRPHLPRNCPWWTLGLYTLQTLAALIEKDLPISDSRWINEGLTNLIKHLTLQTFYLCKCLWHSVLATLLIWKLAKRSFVLVDSFYVETNYVPLTFVEFTFISNEITHYHKYLSQIYLHIIYLLVWGLFVFAKKKKYI